MKHAIVHYDEIALKKGNRASFENKLMENIKAVLKEDVKLKKDYGQLILTLKTADIDTVKEVLLTMPGIAFFSFAKECELDIESICNCAQEIMKAEKGLFRITTKRHNKSFKMKSQEISAKVGECVLNVNKDLKVKMKDYDHNLMVELCNKKCYLSLEEIEGIGGLPVGTAGKMLCLLSGGIDSPVSAYMMMKRGVKVEFVHFQNKTQMTKSVENKIEKLVSVLSKYQGGAKLYIVPFDEIQKEIIKNVNSKLRMLIYRRLMFEIAEKVANREKIKGLVTGDSLAQVASQTLSNMEAVYSATQKLIVTPLIGLNKMEIVEIAKNVGTYDVSILPYADCCSYFVAEHPETNAKVNELVEAEKNIDKDDLVKEAIKGIKIVKA